MTWSFGGDSAARRAVSRSASASDPYEMVVASLRSLKADPSACRWQMLLRIMVPAIRPLIVFVLSIRLMDAFRSFDSIYVLTSGGPGTATETLTMYTYLLAFRFLDIGKASALGVLTLAMLSAMIGGIALIVYRQPAVAP